MDLYIILKNRAVFVFLLISLVSAFSGCADKKDSASCLVQLDAEKYQAVAENTNCSNYHRASAYLGLAGMSFSNFMKTGATDNLTKTLSITSLDNASHYSAGKRDYLTKALCLVGSDNFTSSSRCTGYEKRSGSRTNYDMEISLFGLIGDMIYVNYGILDTDLNGTISPIETTSFSALNSGGVSSSGGGGTSIRQDEDNKTWEVIFNSNDRYIYNDNLTLCLQFTDNYTVTPTPSNTINYSSFLKTDTTCVQTFVSSSDPVKEIRPIFKLDNMTDITGDNASALEEKIIMVSELSGISTSLNLELGNIGMDDNSSLRTSLTKGLSKLDNGGLSDNGSVCTAAAALDVVYLLVKDAADNDSLENPQDLYNENVVNLTDLTSSIDDSITVDTSDLPVSVTKTRFIYATDKTYNSYTDSFEAADPDLYEAIKNTRSLGTETSSKGDGKVIFRELICIGDN